MPKLIVLVGPPGSGKSTAAMSGDIRDYFYINQDKHGKEGHLERFKQAIESNYNIVIDRMNFSKEQRNRYLLPAKAAGYETEIQVFHESKKTCLARCNARKDHETIKTLEDADKALSFFFKSYERVSDDEADTVIRHYPYRDKPDAIICDLDGTLCNIEHRLHYVRTEDKKDWKNFFKHLDKDNINEWCATILRSYRSYIDVSIVLCSGRNDNTRIATNQWLSKYYITYDDLFMRPRNDYRRDDIVKEIILDFEILTRYTPIFMIDDRTQVVEMWRRRGFVCLQCTKGNF